MGDWSHVELEEHVRDGHSTFTWLLEGSSSAAVLRSRKPFTPTTESTPSTCCGRDDEYGGNDRPQRVTQRQPKRSVASGL